MTGILIVTHSRLGDALIEAAEFIIGEKPESDNRYEFKFYMVRIPLVPEKV